MTYPIFPPGCDSLDTFSDWLGSRGLSQRSRNAYVSRVKQYLLFIEGLPDATATSVPRALDEYVQHAATQWSYSKASINCALTAIAKYCEFVRAPMPTVKRMTVEESAPLTLSDEEQAAMGAAIATTSSARERLIAMLFLLMGLRVDELRFLTMSSVHIAPGHAAIDIGGTNARTVTMPEPVRAAMVEWLQIRASHVATADSPVVFPNKNGRVMSCSSVDALVRKVARLSRLNLSAQQLRNTFILNLLLVDSNVRRASEIAGIKRNSSMAKFVSLAAEAAKPVLEPVVPSMQWAWQRDGHLDSGATRH